MSETIEQPRTKTIEVSPGATFEKITYDVMNLRVPTLAGYQKAQHFLGDSAKSTTEFMAQLIGQASDVPVGAVKVMDTDVVLEAFGFVSSFVDRAAKVITDERPAKPERTMLIETPEIVATGKTYSQLELRPPTLNEYQQAQGFMRGTPESSTESMAQLVQRVSGWSIAAIKMLDVDVVMEAFDYVSGFTVAPKKGAAATE